MSKKHIKGRKVKSTNIEKKLQFLLQELKLNFAMEYYVGNYPVDFFLKEHNLSINIDGCWVHGCNCDLNLGKKKYPRQVFQLRRDKACILYHKYSKINIIRIKECTLLNIEESKAIILEVITRISKGEQVHECR